MQLWIFLRVYQKFIFKRIFFSKWYFQPSKSQKHNYNMAGFNQEISENVKCGICKPIRNTFKVVKQKKQTYLKLRTNLSRPWGRCKKSNWEKSDWQSIRNKFPHFAGCHLEAGWCTFLLAEAVFKNNYVLFVITY